jgi:hypothetical protein
MKKNFSRKVIQEALSQELSKGLINEKLSDIPSNIIGGVKNAVSAGYGAYNTGKITNQIKKSAERIGKEWDSTEQVVYKAIEKIDKSGNPQVKRTAQSIGKNFRDLGAEVRNVTTKMSNLSTVGVDSNPDAQAARQNDPNGPLLNGLDDDPEDYKIQDKETKFGNKYKETPVQRWAKKLGMDTDKIGVHEWSALNKAFLEIRSAGANPFTMSPEQVDKMVRYERLRNSNIEKGIPDAYMGTFQHYDYIFGKKKADEMRKNLADKYGVPVEKLRNVFLGDPPEEASTEKPSTLAPQVQSITPTPTPVNAEPVTKPSAPSGMNPNNFAQELGKKPVQGKPAASNKPSNIDPETGRDMSGMKIGKPPAARNQVAPEPTQAGSTYNQMLSLIDDKDFGFTKEEQLQMKNTLDKEGPEAFFQKFMSSAQASQSRPKVQPIDRNAPPRNPVPVGAPSQPKPPAPKNSVVPKPANPPNPGFAPKEPEPIPLTNRKVPAAPEQLPLPPQQTQVKAAKPQTQEPKAFTPPMNDFFDDKLPVPQAPETVPANFGKMPAKDTGKEIQVGSFENPGFGDQNKPESDYETKKQELLDRAKNATSEKDKKAAMNDLQDLFAKDIQKSKPKKSSPTRKKQ